MKCKTSVKVTLGKVCGEWVGNMEEIYSEMIKYAGKYCEYFASDIIYDIIGLKEQFKDGEMQFEETYYCFRHGGVDTHHELNDVKENLYYYDAVLKLTHIIMDRKMLMILGEVIDYEQGCSTGFFR